MVASLLGKKVGMTRIYDDRGVIQPVTVLQLGPCPVLQVKSQETDGYDAVQLGYGEIKRKNATQPLLGHAKKVGATPKAFVREVRLDAPADEQPGQELTVDVFADIKYVDVVGTSKGRGYAGVMKRHNFKGQIASHGVERKHRSPGGIGECSGSKGRGIKKGKRMAGQMGAVRCTSKNHVVMAVDTENNLLLVKGPVAGPNGAYVVVRQAITKR